MNKNTVRVCMRPALVAALSAAVVLGGLTTAYATNAGGFQDAVKIWIGGEAVDATIVQDPESKTGSYQVLDENGDVVMSGGGVAYEPDGTERPITLEEAASQVNNYVDRDSDGTIWIYDGDQAYDITELMESGACNVVITRADGNPVYYEIEANNADGYSYSTSLEPKLPVEEYTVL